MSEVIDKVAALVRKFGSQFSQITANGSNYGETEARVEFIDPLFALMGWDMMNSRGLPNSSKEVVREESQVTESATKRPDYTFRHGMLRKFFVEAKKPSVDIRINRESAFQVRSYGWTAGMSISILTNFRTIRVYDTKIAPKPGESADVGLVLEIDWDQLESRFDEFNKCFGRDAVDNGSIEERFGVATILGKLPINSIFLERFNDWRIRIAQDLHARYADLSLDDISDLAQKLISRLVLIRMCEDRGIEGEGKLRACANKSSLLELRSLFAEMDERYNTGLFDVQTDLLQSKYAIDCALFSSIVEELYFPLAPYSFSVLDADFLGQVYELFLVKRLAINENGQLELRDKPDYEGREVVTTPQPIVDEVVRRTLSRKLAQLKAANTFTFEEICSLKCLDIAVGSGRFLLRCLDTLVDAAIEAIQASADRSRIYERTRNDFRLRFESKRALLSQALYGIDIDYHAVEVARFSLIVKLLEDENRDSLPSGRKILPNLDSNVIWGNSVVSEDFSNADEEVVKQTQPLDWKLAGLPDTFDIVVGNPPYMKTEEMKNRNPAEFDYYRSTFKTPYKQFDKYFVFIERAIQKLPPNGWSGFVVSNKWMTIESGKQFRNLLSTGLNVAEIVNFGNALLFDGKATYVCLLVLSGEKQSTFYYRHAGDFEEWMRNPQAQGLELESKLLERFKSDTWVLPSDENEAEVLTGLCANSQRLDEIADVCNGVQTSAEDVFAVENYQCIGQIIRFTKKGQTYEVEKKITKPYLVDSTKLVWSYAPIKGAALLIFPYEFGSAGEAILIPPAKMKSDYPKAWHYLNTFRDRLLKRDVSPKSSPTEFYRFGRHQALASSFTKPKIIYSVNQLGDKYGFDEIGVGFASGGTAGEVAIMNPRGGYSLEFILALLNQRVIEFMLRKRGSPFRGGYYSRGSAVMGGLPVPIIDFTNPHAKRIHDQITNCVRLRIAAEDKVKGKVGRQVEALKTQIRRLDTEIAVAIHSLWPFTGAENKLKLPGES